MQIEDIDLRSEPVRDILSRPPALLARWGVSVIAGILLLLLALSFWVKYPDELVAEAVITTEALPVSVKTFSTGKLSHLLVKEGEMVAQGTHLAVIENAGRYEDWQALQAQFLPFHKYLMEMGEAKKLALATGRALGEAQPAYTAFFKAHQDYWNFEETNFYEARISQTRLKIIALRQLSQGISEQQAMLLTDYQLAQQQYETDKRLHEKKVLTDREFAQAKQALLQQEYRVKAVDSERINANVRVQELEAQVLELRQAFREERTRFLDALKQASLSLEAAFADWRQRYVLLAPISGKISFFQLLADRQFLRAGDEVLVVVPEAKDIFAYAAVGQVGFGKLQLEQTVNIRLNGFPYEQFGVVKGKVRQISAIARDGKYMVHIALPNGLRTSYGKQLAFSQEMSGEAHIVTQDLMLIERIFYRFSTGMAGE